MTTKPTPKQEEKSEPSPTFLRKVELASIGAACKLLDMPSKLPREEVLAKLTEAQEAELREIENNAIANFQGDLDKLESALGMLRMGHHYGWKVLYIIHSKKTVRNYEGILGIKIREIFPETGPSSCRSIGLNLAMRFSNFWKVVGGDTKIPRKKDAI